MMKLSTELEKIRTLQNILGNPLAAPLIAKIFTPIIKTLPTKGLLSPPLIVEPGETITIVPRTVETGIIRAALLSSNSSKLRYSVSYQAPPEFEITWDYSAEELLFLGLDETTAVGPYVTKAETATHPYLGVPVSVYSIYFPPTVTTAFYDGVVEAKIYNPPAASTANIWLLHFERWKVKDEYVNFFRKLLEI